MGYPDMFFQYDDTQADKVIAEKDQLVDIILDRESLYHGAREEYDRRANITKNSTPGGVHGSGNEKSGLKYISRFGLRGG
jgi:hypothetical protein